MSTLVTTEGRISYPYLFEPKVNALSQDGKKEYSCVFLVSKTDTKFLAELNAAIQGYAAAAVTERKVKGAKADISKVRSPLKDGALKEGVNGGIAEGYEGHFYFTAKSPENRPPKVYKIITTDGGVNKVVQCESATELYGGVYAKIEINLYHYDVAGNMGVGVGLTRVLKTKDGSSFGRAELSVEAAFGLALAETQDSVFDQFL